MTCPVCGASMAVRFAGQAARADLDCHRGCAERAIVEKLRRAAA
jgi:hypothetical protein